MAVNPIKELDFFEAKRQLRDFLSQQEQFKDYNFEGSNMAALLDVLAYNTYQNAFYTNMMFSEMFLDSAQLYNSVASHAKELGYLPRSKRAAKAIITVTIQSSSPQNELVIVKGTKFVASLDGKNFVFTTRRAYVATRVGNTNKFQAKCLDIFQDIAVEEKMFLLNAERGLVITNENVDTETVRMFVDGQEYTYRSTIYGTSAVDRVYFMEIGYDGKYNILFGNNVYGAVPSRSQEIILTYGITEGADANGASSFSSPDFPSAAILTVQPAAGGADRESVKEIKFNAPKSIQIQERAVTASDYKNLIAQRFNNIADISVFGGDELDPPRFGKVAVSINMAGNILPSTLFKKDVLAFLESKLPISLRPIFIDPEFLYAKVVAKIYYDPTTTTKSATELANAAKQLILGLGNAVSFGGSIRQSEASAALQGLGSEITGSSVRLSPVISYRPNPGYLQNPLFGFNTALNSTDASQPAIKSSVFIYDEATEAYLQDNGKGVVRILSADGQTVLRHAAGTINYETGVLKLSNFLVASEQVIDIYANSLELSIAAPKMRILSIREKDITVEMKTSVI